MPVHGEVFSMLCMFLSCFIFWGCSGKEKSGDDKVVAGGSQQLGTGVLALQGGRLTWWSNGITLLFSYKMLNPRVKRTDTAVGRDERALLDTCHVNLRGGCGSARTPKPTSCPKLCLMLLSTAPLAVALIKHKKFLCFHAFFVQKTKGKKPGSYETVCTSPTPSQSVESSGKQLVKVSDFL